jgi:hypothetical protein
MPFNIASGALIYQHGSSVTTTEFALSIVELILVGLQLLGVYNIIGKVHAGYPIIVFAIQVYNIVYSAYVMNYYLNHISIDSTLNGMSLAVIITNAILICSAIGIFGIGRNSSFPIFRVKENNII